MMVVVVVVVAAPSPAVVVVVVMMMMLMMMMMIMMTSTTAATPRGAAPVMARGALRPCAAALLLLAWLGAGAPTSAAAERERGEGPPLLFRGDPRLPASPRPPRLPPRGPRPRRNWDESRYTGSDVTCEETGLRHLHHSLRPVVCTLPRAHAPLRPRPRLAVMVVGLIDRFYPHGVLRHVVAPAARDGFDVDYCVIMVLNSIANFRGNEDNASSTRPPSWIRSTFNAGWLHPTVNPAWKGIGPKGLRDQLIWQGIRHNASRLVLFTLQRDPGSDGNSLIVDSNSNSNSNSNSIVIV